MNDSSEAHNLGQILRLLHLAPVTFRPGLPYYYSQVCEKRNRSIETGTNSDLSENKFLNQDYTSIDKEPFNYLI